MISFSVHSVVEDRKATGLCKLILYLAMFLQLFIISRSFLVEFWGSPIYKILCHRQMETV